MSKLYIHKGIPLVLKEATENVKFYAPVEFCELKEDPCPIFDTGKMSLSLWRTIASFFRKVYKDEKAEAQVRLFYSDATRSWKACAFPQEKDSGMTTKELEDNENFGPLLEAMLEGGTYYQWGTIHSHCDAPAFQSSTDKNDEAKSPGVHITMGKIASDKIDLHSRFTLTIPGRVFLDEKGEEQATRAETYFTPVRLADFIDIPDLYVGASAPQEIKDFAFNHLITLNTEELVDQEMVETWMKSRLAKPVKTYTSSWTPKEYTPSSGSSWGDWRKAINSEWDTWKSKYYGSGSQKKNRKKKQKQNVALLASSSDTEVLLPIVNKVCQTYGITKYKLRRLLQTPDHEKPLDYKDTLPLSMVDAEITQVFGISNATLVKILDEWLDGPGVPADHQGLFKWGLD